MDGPKVLPLLIPQLVNPQLQYEDFEIVHTVLQEMFDVVDKWVYFIKCITLEIQSHSENNFGIS